MRQANAITRERLKSYAETAGTFGDLQLVITNLRQVNTDHAVLHHEGRTTAARGAERVLAGVVRRLCATAAGSEEDARMKINWLASVRALYHENEGDLLMAAMINAAIDYETEVWLASPRQH